MCEKYAPWLTDQPYTWKYFSTNVNSFSPLLDNNWVTDKAKGARAQCIQTALTVMAICALELLCYIKLEFFRSLSFLMLLPDAKNDWFGNSSQVAFFLAKATDSSSNILLFSSSFILSSWWILLRCSNLAWSSLSASFRMA